MSSVFSAETAFRDEEEGLFARDENGQLLRMDKVTSDDFDKKVTIKIDGQPIEVKKAVPLTDAQGNIVRDADGQPKPRATTIYDAACQLFGSKNPIPTLCHQQHLDPVGVCRVCVVEIHKVRDGKPRIERKLLPACQHRVEETMEVHTMASEQAKDTRDPNKGTIGQSIQKSVKLLTEMLTVDHLSPQDPKSRHPANELANLASRLDIDLDAKSRFTPRTNKRGRDDSSFVIAVDHEACILCDRCVRGCDEVRKNLVIGRTGKGYETRIGFDLDQPMGRSTCVSCGECMISCPTGALTLRKTEPVGKQSIPDHISAEELQKNYPIFAGVPAKFLEWNAGSVVRRRVKAGEVLCTQGDPGTTAFVLTAGKFGVHIQMLRKKFGETREEKSGWMRTIFGRVGRSPGSDDVDAESGPHGKRVAIRTPEDLILGEMTCMTHYPRSATVVAMEAGEVLEINRNVLYMLLRNPEARHILGEAYRRHALGSHLDTSPLLANLPDAARKSCIDWLRNKVELVRVDPGQLIFRQGDRADHYYLVRLGFVKVTQEFAGQERVLDYLGPPASFGEIGLLSNIPEIAREHFPSELRRGVRTATCRALDHVELVRIRGEHFQTLVEKSSVLRNELINYAKGLIARNETTRQELDRPLGEFLDQGLFNAQRLLVLDLEACTRCDECTKACSDTHGGVTRLIREGLRFDRFLVASSCRSCLDPYCLVGCPVDAIHRQPRKDKLETALEIVIDESKCIGCGQCAKNCPYGNINMHDVPGWLEDPNRPGRQIAVRQQKATTCDLCREKVPDTEDPSCVHACPHNAAFRMSGKELQARITGFRL